MQPKKGQWKGELINDFSEAVWTHLAEAVSTSWGAAKLKHSKWVKLTKNHETEEKWQLPI